MDFRTLFLLHGVVACTCSASLVALAYIFPRQPGSRFWALSIVQITLGLVCLVGYSQSGWWPLAVLGNWLPIRGFLSLAKATRAATLRAPIPLRWRAALLGISAVVLCYITLSSDAGLPSGKADGHVWFDLRAYQSSLLVSAAIAAAMIVMAADIWASGCHRRPYWIVYNACVALMLVSSCLRLLASLWLGADAAEALHLLNSGFFLVTTVGLIGMTIGAILITAGRLNAEIASMAEQDALTQLLNRRGFFARYSAWTAQASTEPLSLILVDIDRFKAINDGHGHEVGDQVICQVANTLRDAAGQSDWVARFGGEEYVVALPNVRLPDAVKLAEQLRQRIEADAVISRSAGLRITASLGVAQADAGTPFEPLFNAADRALYSAKQGGRNRVCEATAIDEVVA